MNAQCNALYGTALYQRECLTTPKSSEGNRLLATFFSRNIASFAALRNRISLIINRFTPPTHTRTGTGGTSHEATYSQGAIGLMRPIRS